MQRLNVHCTDLTKVHVASEVAGYIGDVDAERRPSPERGKWRAGYLTVKRRESTFGQRMW